MQLRKDGNHNIDEIDEDIANRSKSSIQDIYIPFVAISNAISFHAHLDFKKSRNFLARGHDLTINHGWVEPADNYWTGKFFTIGFITELCEHIVEARKRQNNTGEHWIVSELRIELTKISKAITIADMEARLMKIFGSADIKPALFFDECELVCKNDLAIRHYIFLRKLLRMTGLMPIFMGTQASTTNFVDHRSMQYSSRTGAI